MKCRFIFILIIVVHAMLCSVAMAQHVPSREIDKIDRFSKVSLASGINMVIRKSDRQKITINAERTILPHVVCQVVDGELSIFASRFSYKKSKRIDIVLEVDSALTSITCSSGNHVRCETALPCENLALYGRYGCDFFCNVNAEYLKVNVTSGCDVRLVGNARSCDFFAENASTIRAFGLRSNSVSVAAATSSSVDVSVVDAITVSARGHCEVRYKGDPGARNIIAVSDSRVHAVDDDTL